MHGREWIAKGAAWTREARILAALRTKMLIGAAYAAVTAKTNQKKKQIYICIKSELKGGKVKVFSICPFVAHGIFIVGLLARQFRSEYNKCMENYIEPEPGEVCVFCVHIFSAVQRV